MAGYAQLPGYTVPNALNFDGFNQGVDALGKGIAQNRTNALNMDIGQRMASGDRKGAAGVAYGAGQLETGLGIDKYTQQSEHLDRQARKEDADWFGNQAMAVANLPPGPQRDAAWRNVVSKHPNASSLDPMHLDPISGPTVVSAEYGHFKNKLDEDLKRAQIGLTNAHASHYRQAGDARRAAKAAPGVDPLENMGLDENGNMIELRTSQKVLGVQDVNASSSSSDPYPYNAPTSYGATGRTASQVPGIVVTDKGASDANATRSQRGQDAIDATSDAAARGRLLQRLRDQERWTYANGGKAAPSGTYYDSDGSLVDQKAASKTALSLKEREKLATPLLGWIDDSEKILKSTNVIGRNMATGSFGNIGEYMASPDTREAVAKMKTVATNLAMIQEGKRHANAEEVRFLKTFAIDGTDTQETIERKIKMLRQSYNSAVLHKDAGDGTAASTSAMKSGAYVYDPATGEMKPK